MDSANLILGCPPPEARFSPCERYRYWLRRPIRQSGKSVVFLMLNPSTATATENDPTIRRCIDFADMFGGRELVVVNLFGYRATDPNALAALDDPIGPENDAEILRACRGADLVICAWGTFSFSGGRRLAARAKDVTARLRAEGIGLYALKLTSEGYPSHPLYLKKTCAPLAFA